MVNIISSDSRTDTLNVDFGRLDYLDTYLQQLTDSGAHTFSAVCVLRNGCEIFNGAYGVASPDGTPLATDTIYPMASITKSITATLLAILQEDGIIDLWDKFNRYFPEFTGDKKDEIEVWQVMAHSSGMSDEAMQQYILDYIKEHLGLALPIDCAWEDYHAAVLQTRESLGLPIIVSDEQAFEETETLLRLKAPLATDPGTAFSYCNTGYYLLGKLVEKLAGENIDSYATRKLFKPLHMADTHFNLPVSKWPRVIKRDPTFHCAEWLNADFILTDTNGAGGLKSTLRDLAQFGQMYLRKGTLGSARILSPASIRLLTADHNAKLPASYWGKRWLSSSWGLGWNVCFGKKDDMGLLRSDRAFDHAGAGGARLLIDPDNSLVVAMYLVEKEEMSYENQSRVANIIYSALD